MSAKKAPKGRTKKKNVSHVAAVPKELAAKVLSSVPREQGFYFYSSMGNPTGAISCSFDEFCQNVKSSPSESVEFHLTRGDFENWIRFIGDVELASQIEGLRARNLPREQLMQIFVTTIDERHELLLKSA